MSDLTTTATVPVIDSDVAHRLGHYVYALRDPRDGRIFYVGKGVRNRAYDHVANAANGDSAKNRTIRDIQSQGLSVEHLFIRTNIADDEQAFMVEAAVLDALKAANIRPDNDQGGHISGGCGLSTVRDRVAELSNDPAPPLEPGTIVFIINKLWRRGMPDMELYNRTRGSWVIGENTRSNARIVLGVAQGTIRSAYVINRSRAEEDGERFKNGWLKAPGGRGKRNRWKFTGDVDHRLSEKYVGKNIASRLGRQGSQNPLRTFLSGE